MKHLFQKNVVILYGIPVWLDEMESNYDNSA